MSAGTDLSDVQSAAGMGSEYVRPGSHGGYAFASPGSAARPDRIKPQMQTSAPVMGGAPHHEMDAPDMRPIDTDPNNLKFDEIVLESNEVDLAELQAS